MTKFHDITVLMSTYNGEKYLREQLDSILSQKGVIINLLVRDDGSTDNTQKILEEYKKKGLLNWYAGENLGVAKSFFDLIDNAPDSHFYAFSDQDDVWKKEKLKLAISKLNSDTDLPILYAANYTLVDEKLNDLQVNSEHVTTTTFPNSIICSCCTGSTMVFNKKLKDKIKMHRKPKVVYMHDDWIHKVCLAIGGKVIYDTTPVMLYRQHGSNVDGGIHSFKEKFNKVIRDKKKHRNIMSRQLSELLNIFRDDIPDNNRKLIIRVLTMRKGNFISRMKLAVDKKLEIKTKKSLNNEFRIALLFNYW